MSGKLLLFEGVDGVGKSTAIEIVQHQLEHYGYDTYVYKQHAKPWMDFNTWSYSVLKTASDFTRILADNNYYVIFDRAHISQKIYEKELRNKDCIWFNEYEESIKDIGVLIYITAFQDKIISNIKSRDPNDVIENISPNIVKAFDQAFNDSILPKYTVHNDGDTWDFEAKLRTNVTNKIR